MFKKILLNRRSAIKLGLGFVSGAGISACNGLYDRIASREYASDDEVDNFETIPEDRVDLLAFNSQKIVGATIDRSKIKRTIHVNQNHQNALDSNPGYGQTPLKTIDAALKMAQNHLKKGESIRIKIYSGTYREGEFTIDGSKLGTQAKNATLVIEGSGEVIISGSEIWQANRWQKVNKGGILYYQHDWNYDFGNSDGAWGKHGPKKVIAHRREMVFINDKPLKQVLLEKYDYTWPNSFRGRGSHKYSGLNQPEKTLEPNSFGVTELDRNGNKIYLRKLNNNVNLSQAKIEVATKKFIFRFFNINNVVLNNLTFQHSAGELEVPGAAVLFGPWYGENELRNSNIEITNCNFYWNNARGLNILNSRKVTLKNNKFNYNGFAGVTVHFLINTIWENNETNFNNWRGYRAGFVNWAIAGAKIHYTRNGIFRNHRAIGNKTRGLWFDLANKNILVENLTAINNIQGLKLEVSPGPFIIDKSILASNQETNFLIDNAINISLKNSIIYGDTRGDCIHITSDDSRTYQDLLGQLLGESNGEKIPIYLSNTSFKNNVVLQSDPNNAILVQSRGNPQIYQDFISQEYLGTNNSYFSQNKQPFGLGFQKTNMTNMAGWKKATKETNSKWENPKFANPRNYDLRIRNKNVVSSKTNIPNNFRLNTATINKMNDFFSLLK